MAEFNTSTVPSNAPHSAAPRITRYDALTTDELIEKALRVFGNSDELAIALAVRLMDLQSELDTVADVFH